MYEVFWKLLPYANGDNSNNSCNELLFWELFQFTESYRPNHLQAEKNNASDENPKLTKKKSKRLYHWSNLSVAVKLC